MVNILFIGGTGVISTSCTRLAVERGMHVTVLNRGRAQKALPAGVKTISADIHDVQDVRHKLKNQSFDVVVDWIAYTCADVERDFELFQNKCRQFIFISSASAYKKPARLPINETWPLENPYWKYSRDKIACETFLMQKYRDEHFPVTVVRPSHTFDETKIPLRGGWTSFQRMLEGKPVFIHGDGTSVWTLTHTRDFAKGFIGLFDTQAIGETFHITSDEWLTWNEIYQIFADHAGVDLHAFHVLSQDLAEIDPALGDGLLGDKSHSMIFDNTKIKKWVPDFKADIPFAVGAKEIADYYFAHQHSIQPDQGVIELYKKLRID